MRKGQKLGTGVRKGPTPTASFFFSSSSSRTFSACWTLAMNAQSRDATVKDCMADDSWPVRMDSWPANARGDKNNENQRRFNHKRASNVFNKHRLWRDTHGDGAKGWRDGAKG